MDRVQAVVCLAEKAGGEDELGQMHRYAQAAYFCEHPSMPVTNALKRLMQKTRSLSYCIGLVMVVLFVYGLIRYPDLPIRECPSGYCGRQGQPHTAAEYNAFSIWQTTLFIVWPIGMLIMLLLQRGKPKR
jgi:predicted secreted protein